MKIEDLIDKMSKSYLERIVKSFTDKDYKKDEEGYKKQILSNVDHLSKPEVIKNSLDEFVANSKNPYQKRLLLNFVLRVLLGSNQYKATDKEIKDKIRKLEQEIIKKAKQKENFTHMQNRSVEIMEAVLDAALEDEMITDDELHLINKIRQKLSLQVRDQYQIQAKIGYFPKKGNKVHEYGEVNEGLMDLQKCGVLFYCNQMDGQPFCIPEELVEGVKRYLGIELIEDKFKLLLDQLNTNELRDVLEMLNIKQYGRKDELIERILITGIKPSEVLEKMSNNRLSEICRKLPDVNVSGTKPERINRIINYFDVLLNIDINSTKDKREIYYKVYEQLAKRDMKNLMGKKIVKQEAEAERAFEIATNYLFEQKLYNPVMKQNGTEHSDGCLVFNRNGELMLWDNKTKFQEKYNFPNAHLRQFKRYIRDLYRSGKRVTCFLVIVPDIDPSSRDNAMRLKYESGIDTDVAIISAENLKWIAEEWCKSNDGKSFNLEVFNMTGILTKEEIKSRIKLFS